MNKAMIGGAILVLCIFALLISCVSLPAPKSDGDTLFIIPVSAIRATSEQYFGLCELRIVRSGDNYETFCQINPDSHYGMIVGLSPGQYAVREISARYKAGSTAWARKTDIQFALVSGCVTILPQEIVFKIEKKANQESYQMFLSWGVLTQSTAKKLLQELGEQENYQYWQLSESTKEIEAVVQALSEL